MGLLRIQELIVFSLKVPMLLCPLFKAISTFCTINYLFINAKLYKGSEHAMC